MTIPPSTGPLTYSVETHPSQACPGGRVELVVHAHNNGQQAEVSDIGLLIGGLPHIGVGEVRFDVPAAGDASSQIIITVPLLPAGRYTIDFVGGTGPGPAGGSLSGGVLVVNNPVSP